MRIIEGSAFVAAPLGGMTLAQLGADVIRFDNIGGGLDYRRWPITKDGHSLYWADLNKGETVNCRQPAFVRGARAVDAAYLCVGEGRRVVFDQLSTTWLAGL